MSMPFLLSAHWLLSAYYLSTSAYFLVVDCYKRRRLTSSFYGIECFRSNSYSVPALSKQYGLHTIAVAVPTTLCSLNYSPEGRAFCLFIYLLIANPTANLCTYWKIFYKPICFKLELIIWCLWHVYIVKAIEWIEKFSSDVNDAHKVKGTIKVTKWVIKYCQYTLQFLSYTFKLNNSDPIMQT